MIITLELSLDNLAKKRKLALATSIEFFILQAKINMIKDQSSKLLISIKALKGKTDSSKVSLKTLEEHVAILNIEIAKKHKAIADGDQSTQNLRKELATATKSMKHLQAKTLQMKILVNLAKWENHQMEN